jgi:hypothetical protein
MGGGALLTFAGARDRGPGEILRAAFTREAAAPRGAGQSTPGPAGSAAPNQSPPATPVAGRPNFVG